MEKWTKEERKSIGNKIQSARKQKGLLQEDLANLVGLKVGTISKYEQGDRTPGIRQLTRIAEVLDCSVTDLISEAAVTETARSAAQTDFDAFLQWLSLCSIQATPTSEDSYTLQAGSREFHLTEEELQRIMGFLKKQFLKVLLQMSKNMPR